MPTEFGITYEIEESTLESQQITVESDFIEAEENTSGTMKITFPDGTSTTFFVDRTQSGIDPDVYFGETLDDFEYFERDYIENNPGTVNNVLVSYVGSYYSDTTGESTIGTGLLQST